MLRLPITALFRSSLQPTRPGALSLSIYKAAGSFRSTYTTSPKISTIKHLTTMTSNIVLPSLSSWAQSHITALFQATTPEDFDSAFDAFLAAHVESITVNGETLTKEQYKQRLQRAKAFEQGAEVTFLGTVEAKSEKEGEKVSIIYAVSYILAMTDHAANVGGNSRCILEGFSS